MTSFRAIFAAGLTAALFVLVTAMQAPAAGCGDPAPPPDGNGEVTAADALYCLQMAVGSQPVNLTTCDTDDNGGATAADALRILQSAVGQTVTLVCPMGCEGSTGPACGGACPSGSVCIADDFDVTSCFCASGCETETAPTCTEGDCTAEPGKSCQIVTLAAPDLDEQADLCECIPPGLQACVDSAGSGCDGACSPGSVCGGSGLTGCTCEALPVQVTCAVATAPSCGGTCSTPGEVCSQGGSGSCSCGPGPETCEGQPWPSCGGVCDGGRYCAADILGDCECLDLCEIGQAPACGGTCLDQGDACFRVTATVGGETIDFCQCISTTSTTTTTMPPPSCFSSSAPTCGGDCPAGEFCIDDGFGCDCIPGCEGEEAGFCGGGDCTTRPGWDCQHIQIALPDLGESEEFCECLPPDIQLCEDTLASGCDGVCGDGQLCENGSGGCTCSAQPLQGSCAGASQPACGGTCGPGEICTTSGPSGCACAPSGFETCLDQSGPSCGGSCFGGALCAVDIFGDCDCFSPCELDGDEPTCGGFCVEPGDQCVHIQATVNGGTLDLCSCE